MEFHVESSALASLRRGFVLTSAPVMHLPLVAQDEIHHRLRILARQWEVTLTLGHQHRDLPAEFLVPLLHHPCLVFQPRVETPAVVQNRHPGLDRKSTRLNSSHQIISYAVFSLKKKKKLKRQHAHTH